MRTLVLAAALVTLTVAAAPAAQGDLNGTWTLSFNTPNGLIDATAKLAVDGEKLTGTLSGPQGETALTGTVKGTTFTASFEVQSPQGNIAVTLTGELAGEELKGTFDFGMGIGDWTGKRAQ